MTKNHVKDVEELRDVLLNLEVKLEWTLREMSKAVKKFKDALEKNGFDENATEHRNNSKMSKMREGNTN